MEQAIETGGIRDPYYWATHNGAELDLLFFARGGKPVGIEIKATDAPKVTKSMQIAMEDLKLERLLVVYPGERSWRMAPKIEAVGIKDLPAALK